MQIFGSAKNAHCFVSDVVVVLLSTSLVSPPKKQQLRIGPLFCNFMTWKRRVQFGLCLSTPVFIFSWLIAHMENLKPQLIHHNHRTAHFLAADNTYIIHSWAEVREVFFRAMLCCSSRFSLLLGTQSENRIKFPYGRRTTTAGASSYKRRRRRLAKAGTPLYMLKKV